jgi:hypothetical protein
VQRTIRTGGFFRRAGTSCDLTLTFVVANRSQVQAQLSKTRLRAAVPALSFAALFFRISKVGWRAPETTVFLSGAGAQSVIS